MGVPSHRTDRRSSSQFEPDPRFSLGGFIGRLLVSMAIVAVSAGVAVLGGFVIAIGSCSGPSAFEGCSGGSEVGSYLFMIAVAGGAIAILRSVWRSPTK